MVWGTGWYWVVGAAALGWTLRGCATTLIRGKMGTSANEAGATATSHRETGRKEGSK